MYIILGATGHIGSVVAKTLLETGEKVTVITRDDHKRKEWEDQGAEVAVVDIYDTKALNQVFQQGKRLFLLNPPASPSTDTAQEERKSVAAILAAIEGADLEKIVAESTYGAQPGDQLGDLGVLYELEQKLAKLSISVSIIRGAYYMSNWDFSLQSAKEEGVVHTLYPADFELPMVAPADIGKFAAHLLTAPLEQNGLFHVEGPQTYSSADVADAFASALNKNVKAVTTPQEHWKETLVSMGFSEKAAESMANMTDLTLNGQPEPAQNPHCGETTLQDYISDLVKAGEKVGK